MRFAFSPLAVDDAILRTAALGTKRKGLAKEINIPVPIAGERPVSQLDDIPVHGCVDGRLDGRVVPSTIRIDHVGRTLRDHGNEQ